MQTWHGTDHSCIAIVDDIFGLDQFVALDALYKEMLQNWDVAGCHVVFDDVSLRKSPQFFNFRHLVELVPRLAFQRRALRI